MSFGKRGVIRFPNDQFGNRIPLARKSALRLEDFRAISFSRIAKRSCGNRSTPPDHAPTPSPDQEPEPPVTRQPRATASEEPLSLVDFILFGVGLIALAVCLIIYLKKTPSQPPRVGAAVDAAVERAPPVTSAVSPMETVRQRLDEGEAGRTFEFAIIASPSARCFARINAVRPWRHPGWTNRGLDEANTILKFEYEVAGLALNCLMTEDQRRFCKATERAKITKAVAFYLAKYRRDVAAKKRVGKAPALPQDQMYRDLAERMNAMDPGAADDVGVDDPTELFKGIASVTDAGYFTAADFGSAPELAPHIRPSLAKPCG